MFFGIKRTFGSQSSRSLFALPGEPDVALLRNEADDEDNHQRRHDPKTGEDGS